MGKPGVSVLRARRLGGFTYIRRNDILDYLRALAGDFEAGSLDEDSKELIIACLNHIVGELQLVTA